jgi:hypothetical protein
MAKHAEVIDMTDGAIKHDPANAATWIDPQTSLEWQCKSPGRMSWHAAQSYALSLSISGKDNWRLPTVRERG